MSINLFITFQLKLFRKIRMILTLAMHALPNRGQNYPGLIYFYIIHLRARTVIIDMNNTIYWIVQ